MATHPKGAVNGGKKPFALKRTKPFTKAQLAEQARRAHITMSTSSSDERVLNNTPSLLALRAFLSKPLP